MKTNRAYVGGVGILGLLFAGAMIVGCSSGETSSNSTGKGGSTGSGNGGTTGSGNGGTTGSGNGGTTGSGNGGTPGTGAGGAPAVGCATGAAPAAALLSDFSGGADGGSITHALGGMFTYGTPSPSVSLTSGALHATLNAGTGAAVNYVGFGLYFNACVDATQYTGVKFKLGGTIGTGCMLVYSHNFRDDAFHMPPNDVKGSCTLGPGSCYSPQKTLTVPATSTEISVAFTDVMGGSPVMNTVDKAHLTGLQWQFVVPTEGCTADITLDDVSFY